MPDIHFTDQMLGVLFSFLFTFAVWCSIKLWHMDIKLTKVCEQISYLIRGIENGRYSENKRSNFD